MDNGTVTMESYKQLLQEIKVKVRTSQVKAALSVNEHLIKLYWDIGLAVHRKQKAEGWGAKVSDRLAKDLKSAFPDMRGFSSRNIRSMVQLANAYSNSENGKQLVSQIPWGHNILIMQRLGKLEERIWYIKKTIENGWSRAVLETWIDSKLYQRQGKAVTNFAGTLPPIQSDLADQSLKDPYVFDFLTLREKFDERELENGLLDHIQKFLLELGTGFSFVGRQVRLEVGDQVFYCDLLFYHFKLRCFVVVELKATEFKPEYTGKLNFYLTAIDRTLRHPDDNPTIGLLLCKTKDEVIAEYALSDMNKPIGIAEYEIKILESLPDELKGSLPTIEEIEQELERKQE